MDILEYNKRYNKRCAEFLGLELAGPGFISGYFYNDDYYHFEDMKFHLDWNWIMEVIEKIENFSVHGFTIYRITTNINGLPLRISNTTGSTKKEAVVKAIDQFLINYYNLI